jgi:hypothetical protein
VWDEESAIKRVRVGMGTGDEQARTRVQARINLRHMSNGRVLDLAVEADSVLAGDVQAQRDLDYAPPGIFDLGIGLFGERGLGAGRSLRLVTTSCSTKSERYACS